MAKVLGNQGFLAFAVLVAMAAVFFAPRPDVPVRTAASLGEAHGKCVRELDGRTVNFDSHTSEFVCFDSRGNELGRMPRR